MEYSQSLTAESKENNASVVLLPYNGTEAQRWKAEQGKYDFFKRTYWFILTRFNFTNIAAGELWIFRLRLNENLILTEDNSEDSYLSRVSLKRRQNYNCM